MKVKETDLFYTSLWLTFFVRAYHEKTRLPLCLECGEVTSYFITEGKVGEFEHMVHDGRYFYPVTACDPCEMGNSRLDASRLHKKKFCRMARFPREKIEIYTPLCPMIH